MIVDDLSAPDAPNFQDGDIAQAALDAIDDGVVYVSAAGNYAQKHYQADFDGDAGLYHQFATGDNLIPFVLDDGESVFGTLQWSDEWGASGNDYDLYLNKYNGGTWQTVGVSWIEQDGDDDPLEYISYTNNSGSADYYAWQINKYSGSDRELELYMFNTPRTFLSYGVATDSIFGHAAAEGVIAVGAIDASDTGNDTIEPFSSRGPSTVYTNFSTQTSTQRDSLDVAGIDGVSTKAGDDNYFAYEPFYGTSAAAPHVAAIAALLLEIDSGSRRVMSLT